jgi:cold-inducible RNA-binding protein
MYERDGSGLPWKMVILGSASCARERKREAKKSHPTCAKELLQINFLQRVAAGKGNWDDLGGQAACALSIKCWRLVWMFERRSNGEADRSIALGAWCYTRPAFEMFAGPTRDAANIRARSCCLTPTFK